MNRRNLLKVLPLAAVVGTSVSLGETEARAFEMKPDKKYLFVVSDVEVSDEEAVRMRTLLLERGIDATICRAPDLKVYELE